MSRSTATSTGSKARASRAGSWASSSSSGQRPWASRRRRPGRTPSARAAAEQATTRLAWTTAVRLSGGAPAATTGQSGHQTTTMRGIADHPVSASGVRPSPAGASPSPARAGRLGPPTRSATGGHEGDGAARGREPEEDPAFAGGGAAAGDEDLDLAGLEAAVALAEALPGAGGDGQAQVGRLGPGAEGDEDGTALAGPGGEAAGLGGREPGRGADEHDVDRVQEGGHHGRPGPGAGGGDQGQALQGDAGLGGGDDPEVGQADRGHPGTGRRGPGNQGQGEGGGAADGHRRAPAQPLAGKQRLEGGDHRQQPLVGQGRPRSHQLRPGRGAGTPQSGVKTTASGRHRP